MTGVERDRPGVAIVGMGALFPGASDLARFWHNLSAGVDAISEAPPDRLDPAFFDPASSALDRFSCRRGGFVDGLAMFDPLAFGMMPVSVDAVEPDQLIALSTAAAAIDDAGGVAALPSQNVAVIIGRGGYMGAGLSRMDQRLRMAEQLVRSLGQMAPGATAEELNAVRAEFQRQVGPYRPDDAIGLVPNLVASRIANRFDFSGPAYTVDAACASSLIAVDHGLRLLRAGECDAVIAGGVHHCHDLTLWGVFSHLGALSASGRSRPFSRTADGLLIGEGTGMLVLKRLVDAEADGDRVYAVIRGIGVSSDGRESTVMHPRVAGQVLALRRAWEAVGLDPATIGLLEAHGTATPTGDAAEIATLTEVFGPPTSGGGGPGPVGIGSVKSMIGHTMPAAGAAGLIKSALALHHQILPPTLHCEEPHPALADTRFRPVAMSQPWEAAGFPRRAGVNSFGFGGINAHAILEEHHTTRESWAPPPRPAPILLCAADDTRSLLAQLDQTSGPLGRTGRMRLAIVNPTPERLDVARKVVGQGDAWRGRMDIWFSPQPLLSDGGRLAFLFPGIEASVPGPVDEVADRFGLARLAPADSSELGRRGIGVFWLGRLLEAALDGIGIRPEVLAGHSIGEWNGMVSAGMVRPEMAGPFLSRLEPSAIGMPDLVYAAAGCASEVANEAIDGLHEVVVSHDNCPHQSILCGAEPGITEAMARLRARRVMVSELPFRSGFHSPMFVPRLRQVREALALLPIGASTVTLWSATTCEPYPTEPDEIRELAARHLIEPVRFRELTLELYGEGVRAFVQVGVGSLTAFVDDTLRDHPHLAVAAATPKGDALDQLRRVAAALWAEGAAVQWDRLVAHSHLGGANRTERVAAAAVPSPGHSPQPRPVSLATPLVSLADLPPLQHPARQPAAMVGAHGEAVPGAGAAGALASPPPPVDGPTGGWGRKGDLRRGPEPGADHRVHQVSVERFPWLADHCLVRQRRHWPSMDDRFPVVALTTMVQWMVDGAIATQPGRVVARLERIRATRLLVGAPPVEVMVTMVAEGPDQVRVAIEGYAQATVVLADRPVAAPAADTTPLAFEEPSVYDAESLYEHRWLFHGPQFQAIVDISGICDLGIRGHLKVLQAPGSLLDGAGQLFGYWVMARLSADRIVLPLGIDRIELFGPEPPVGTVVDCVARITSVDDASVQADIDLSVGGRLWARVVGWADHRFETDAVLWDVLRFPEYHLASERRPGGWVLTRERWKRSASRDIVMRQYLGGAERAHYHTLNPLAQRQWLLGRMAAKDAVRDWLWNQGGGPVFPAEVDVSNGSHGEPLVRGDFQADLRISIAHSRTLGVSIVGVGVPVGIDIEVVAPHDDRFEQMVLTSAEQALVPAAGRPQWLTRFWVAKEAISKANTTGLLGRPKDFEVTAVDRGALRIDDHWVDTDVVTDEKGDDFIVGWTRRDDV